MLKKINCEHFSYCGLPRIHKDINFCLNKCLIKHKISIETDIYYMLKSNCEKLKIDKTLSNIQYLKIITINN